MRPFERRRFISEVQKEENRLYSLHLGDIGSDMSGKVDEEFNGKVKEALNEPEIHFYLRFGYRAGSYIETIRPGCLDVQGLVM